MADGVLAQLEAAFQLTDLFLIHGDLAVSNVFCAALEYMTAQFNGCPIIREIVECYKPCPGGVCTSISKMSSMGMTVPLARMTRPSSAMS